ncbi:hypothetical protein CCH79_00007291 [Gambusia affinis]|uniref:Dilute domain-containing protein n=1 Tax=Gambusia affinis TaxID=33528 RepID=A0A315VFF8_GAMAF|nr:hypothetical protein CCH79_00007291 [Gambusia affinis]
MEKTDVAKDPAVKKKGEDLEYAYDAVRVANKFLESQLQKQQAEWKDELEDLRNQLSQKICSGSSPAKKRFSFTFISLSAPTTETLCAARPKPAAVAGLLECRKRDETKLLKNLITDLRSEGALALPPGLPASVIFLCVRQADSSGDQARARSLCSAALVAMKAALKKQTSDLDMTALWLKNSLDSDELVSMTTDLSDLTRSLSDLCIQAYQQLLSITETQLQKLIVPALLESETIAGLSGSAAKLVVSRKRAGSDPRPLGADAPTMALVLRQLGALHTALSRQALPQSLAEQAFRQMTYLICASALNNLLLRKDMCCCSRGMQIRYNLSVLEEWLRSRGLAAGGAVATLEPLIQAAQLLQVGKKTDADAQAIVLTCTALSSKQIMKILTLYTPHSDLDEKVSLNFIRTVQELVKGRSDSQPPQLLMDVRRAFPVTVPYSPTPALSADDLVIPDSLKISFLRRS